MSRRYTLLGLGHGGRESIKNCRTLSVPEHYLRGNIVARKVIAAFYNSGNHLYFDTTINPLWRMHYRARLDVLLYEDFQFWNRTATGIPVRHIGRYDHSVMEFDIQLFGSYLELELPPLHYLRFVDFGRKVLALESRMGSPKKQLTHG